MNASSLTGSIPISSIRRTCGNISEANTCGEKRSDANTGAFQNLPIEDLGGSLGEAFNAPEYYADSTVIAFKTAPSDVPLASFRPVITTSSGAINPALLTDGDLVKTVALPMAKQIGDKAWIQYEFSQPQTIRAITLVAGQKSALDAFLPPGGESGKALEASDDGQNCRCSTSTIMSERPLAHPLGQPRQETKSAAAAVVRVAGMPAARLLRAQKDRDWGLVETAAGALPGSACPDRHDRQESCSSKWSS